jgi:hypothetical protein
MLFLKSSLLFVCLAELSLETSGAPERLLVNGIGRVSGRGRVVGHLKQIIQISHTVRLLRCEHAFVVGVEVVRGDADGLVGVVGDIGSVVYHVILTIVEVVEAVSGGMVGHLEAEGAEGGWRGALALWRVSFDKVRRRAVDVEGGEIEVVRRGSG